MLPDAARALAEPECVDQLRMNHAPEQRVGDARVHNRRRGIDAYSIIGIELKRTDPVEAASDVDLQHRRVPGEQRRRFRCRKHGNAERVDR